MNEPRIDEAAIAETDPRVNPNSAPCSKRTSALFCAICTGLAIGLIVRALRREPSRTERLAHLLEDLDDRVRGHARPALRKATTYAAESADVLRDGLHHGEALLQRSWRDTTRSIRRLFS